MIGQQRGEVQYVQFAQYLQFPEIIHGSFTRLGGYSKTPYWGLNVSFSIGDEFENVIRNRLQALSALHIQDYPCATLWLIHGADVATLNGDGWDDWRFDWPHRSYLVDSQELIWTVKPRRKADAIITKQRGVALALSSADCVPVMYYDPVHEVIGMAHAGWRGTARGIAAATVEAMHEQFDSQPRDIYAGIGPSIGPCCYEVSEEVRELFYSKQQFAELPTAEKYRNLVRESAVFDVGARLIAPSSVQDSALSHVGTRLIASETRPHLDLWETNRSQLLMAGLLPEHIELPGICTNCEKERFFSYRGEHGKTGRFPSILALRKE